MSIISTVPKGAAVEGINPNLLRNWYFVGGGTGRGVFPVNSRGASSYAWAGGDYRYAMDGWRGAYPQIDLTLISSGLQITYVNTSQGGNLDQQINLVSGLIYTASALTSLGLLTSTATVSSTISSGNPSLSTTKFRVHFSPAQLNCIVYAVKVELGDQQTLCHQENGVWVLNEIPDYEYELYRCKTSTADPSDIYANKSLYPNVPNKNLLDNWYFVGGGSQLGDGIFPINQRGQAQYTLSSGVYTLDRWRAYKYSGSATVNLTANGLEISGENSSFSQKVKVSPAELLGKTVTLSVLVDGNLLSETAVMPTSFNQSSNVINIQRTGFNVALVSRPAPAGWTNAYCVSLGTLSTTVKVIKAVKLEFGTEQTLAHQENGVWVLNEIPDYGEELAKCLRYYWNSSADNTAGLQIFGMGSATGNGFGLVIATPVPMRRVTPTISGTISWVRGEGSEVSGCTLEATSAKIINGYVANINVSKTGAFTARKPYSAYLATFTVSCEP